MQECSRGDLSCVLGELWLGRSSGGAPAALSVAIGVWSGEAGCSCPPPDWPRPFGGGRAKPRPLLKPGFVSVGQALEDAALHSVGIMFAFPQRGQHVRGGVKQLGRPAVAGRPRFGFFPLGALFRLSLTPSLLEDQVLPAFAVQRELLAGALEALYRRQQVLHPLFLPEQCLGRAACFR